MSPWETAADIAQVLATLLAAVAVIVAFELGRRELMEARQDRRHNVLPLLMFDEGSQLVACVLEPLVGVPGIDPAVATQFTSKAPPGARRCVLHHDAWWGRLRNHGVGSALFVKVTFAFHKRHEKSGVFSGDEVFSTPAYHSDFNTFPCSPSHLSPGESGTFYRLPTPIVVDHAAHLERLECMALVTYEDIYRSRYNVRQPLTLEISRDYGSETARVLYTFGEALPHGANDAKGSRQ